MNLGFPSCSRGWWVLHAARQERAQSKGCLMQGRFRRSLCSTQKIDFGVTSSPPAPGSRPQLPSESQLGSYLQPPAKERNEPAKGRRMPARVQQQGHEAGSREEGQESTCLGRSNPWERCSQSSCLPAFANSLKSLLGRFTPLFAACGYAAPHPHVQAMAEVKQRFFIFFKRIPNKIFLLLSVT